jgi:putative sporulation protein YyaC
MFKDTNIRTGSMPFKVDHNTPQAADHLAERMVNWINEHRHFHKIVIVCIGTDRSTGDALGPLVGSKLSTHLSPAQAAVYGTLESPVHAVNLKDTIQEIESTHINPFVIAVDACLGQLSSVGLVTLANGPLKPGAGVNKVLPEVGNIHLTGIVNVGGFMEYFVLQNTRLSVVMRMADTIADSLTQAITGLDQRPFPIDVAQPIQDRIESKRSNLFRFL